MNVAYSDIYDEWEIVLMLYLSVTCKIFSPQKESGIRKTCGQFSAMLNKTVTIQFSGMANGFCPCISESMQTE